MCVVSETGERIERILTERFRPLRLRLRDDSANHVGHAGATSGGGHYKVLIVSELFEGRSLLERHRMVNEALSDLFGGAIHALSIETLAPSQWREGSSG